MNLHHLKTFYLAAKHENVSRAASELNIAQPAATRHLKDLQHDIGIELFETRGKKLYLTDAGRILYGRAENIFNEEAYLMSSIEEIKRSRHGIISLASRSTFSELYLPDALAGYYRKMPEIGVNISNFRKDSDIVTAVERMEFDIGITTDRPESLLIVSQPLLAVRQYLVTGPAHPLASEKVVYPQMLDGQVFIMPERLTKSRILIDSYFRNNLVNYQSLYEPGSLRAMISVVKKGIGITIAYRKAAEDEAAAGKVRLIPIHDPESYLSRRFYLIHHRDKEIDGMIDVFINVLRECCVSEE